MGSSGDAKKLWRSKTVFKNQRRAARLGDAGGRDSRVEATRCKSWAARGVPTVQFTRPVPPGRRTSQNVRTSKSPSRRICRKITTMITLTSFALARSRAHQASRSADSRMCAEGRAHRPVMGSFISFLDWLRLLALRFSFAMYLRRSDAYNINTRMHLYRCLTV